MPDAPPENAEVVVTGTYGQLTLNVGGKKEPTRSVITITGGKFPIDGQFAMLERLSLVLQGPDGERLAKAPLLIDHVSMKAYVDTATGEATDVERQHKARVQK